MNRALLIDDNEINRDIAVAMLELLGWSCDTVGEGSEGLRLFREGSYGLVLLDWMMPGMDGLAVAAALRKIEADIGGPRTPLVLMSASASQWKSSPGEPIIDACLSKPFRLEQLEATIQSLR